MSETKSICEQILNLLLIGLPHTNAEIGIKVQSLNIAFDSSQSINRVLLELSPSEYSGILPYITDANKNNFTISGVYLKNYITEFTHFTQNLFTVRFTKPHTKKHGDVITLEGFPNAAYNTTYTVTRTVDDFTLRLKNNDIPQTSLTTVLGYNAIEYIGGLNTTTTLQSQGANQVFYVFNEEYFSPTAIADIDTTKKPYINYLYANVLCYDNNSFLEQNLSGQGDAISRFIVIDTSSVTFSPHRSNSNKSDSNYSTIGATSQFARNVSLNLYYIIEGNTNSSTSDKELMKLDRALNLILRRSLDIENGYSTTLTIGGASKVTESSIQDGRAVFEYNIEFYISYTSNDDILTFHSPLYPIERVQVNNDLIDFT